MGKTKESRTEKLKPGMMVKKPEQTTKKELLKKTSFETVEKDDFTTKNF